MQLFADAFSLLTPSQLLSQLAKVLTKQGPNRATAARLATQIQDEAKSILDSTLPLMALICTQGLQDRHWAAMETVTGLSLPHDATTTVRDMVTIGLQAHVAAIEDTCVSAQKEAALVKVTLHGPSRPLKATRAHPVLNMIPCSR